jgi:XXXCH domain-containing protein
MGSWKIEHELAKGLEPGGLPQFLRELAGALETGVAEGLLDGLPQDYRKLVLVAERLDSGLLVKLKAKRSGEVRVPTEDAPHKAKASPRAAAASETEAPLAQKDTGKTPARSQPACDKYRLLKKSLQADYKVMQAAVREGRLPGAETLDSFMSLAELMGQGEPPVTGAAQAEMVKAGVVFWDDCQALRRGHAARDLTALAEVLERLARRKSACHAQFR